MSESIIRLGAFSAIFVVMALAEIRAPRRTQFVSKPKRWITNSVIFIIDILVLRVVFPAAAVGIAVFAQGHDYGIFPALGLPVVIAGVAGFVLLDFAVWAFHVASHKWPILWRLHRVHHSDRELDVTSAVRFHPIEILISMFWKGVVIIAFGIPPEAVLVFEIVLNAGAIFNHANYYLPEKLDRWIRRLVVTPDMHRIHHSVWHKETDSNYGFNLSIWDRMFKTYTPEPKGGQRGMTIGLNEYQHEGPEGIAWSLLLPIQKVNKRMKSKQRRDTENV